MKNNITLVLILQITLLLLPYSENSNSSGDGQFSGSIDRYTDSGGMGLGYYPNPSLREDQLLLPVNAATRLQKQLGLPAYVAPKFWGYQAGLPVNAAPTSLREYQLGMPVYVAPKLEYQVGLPVNAAPSLREYQLGMPLYVAPNLEYQVDWSGDAAQNPGAYQYVLPGTYPPYTDDLFVLPSVDVLPVGSVLPPHPDNTPETWTVTLLPSGHEITCTKALALIIVDCNRLGNDNMITIVESNSEQ
jgi:hypothetical protein